MYTEFFHPHISPSKLSATLKKANAYTETLQSTISSKDYTKHESSLAIAGDTRYQNAILKALTAFGKVKHVVLIGIGGSSLGTQAVYEALKTPSSPSLLVLDALETSSIEQLSTLVKKVKNKEDIALVIISKSGSTTETLCNADIAFRIFEKSYGPSYVSRVIAIGDAGTPFLTQAKKQKMLTFSIPQSIGGRFSVFTAVGMVPLTLLGIDTVALRKGAIDGVTPDNIAIPAKEATILSLSARMEYRSVNFFTFSEKCKTIGYWYRQLLAESIGKSVTVKKKKFDFQLLPTVSSSIDLHSVAQLYLSNYAGVYTKFLYVSEDTSLATQSSWISNLVPSIADKEISTIKSAIKTGVESAYHEALLPHQSTTLDTCDASHVGYMLSQYMAEVMILCNLLEINAFDQPHVELYKTHMRAALAS